MNLRDLVKNIKKKTLDKTDIDEKAVSAVRPFLQRQSPIRQTINRAAPQIPQAINRVANTRVPVSRLAPMIPGTNLIPRGIQPSITPRQAFKLAAPLVQEPLKIAAQLQMSVPGNNIQRNFSSPIGQKISKLAFGDEPLKSYPDRYKEGYKIPEAKLPLVGKVGGQKIKGAKSLPLFVGGVAVGLSPYGKTKTAFKPQQLEMARNFTPEVRSIIGRVAETLEKGKRLKQNSPEADYVYSLAETVFGKQAANLSPKQIVNAFDALQESAAGMGPTQAKIGLGTGQPISNSSTKQQYQRTTIRP